MANGDDNYLGPVDPFGPGAFDDPLAGQVPLLAELMSARGEDLTDPEVADALLALVKLSGQIDAAVTRYAAVFEARILYAVDGAPAARGWLAARSELSKDKAGATFLNARALRACPHVADAWANGVLGTAKVTMLLMARKQVEALFGEHEEELVDHVAPLTVDQARIAIDRWREMALATLRGDDPDDRAPGDEDANTVHLSQTFQGRWALKGDLDAVSGTELRNALDAIIDASFRAGTATTADCLHRSQRNAAALMDLVRRNAVPGTRHGAPIPSVQAIVDFDAYFGRPAHTVADGLDRRRCHLADGTPIDPATLERLMCEGDVTEILTRFGLDGRSEPLGVTHTRRHATANERVALRERDRGCVFPGCHAPVEWTDAHHTVPYSMGRRTQLSELVLVCRFHHHQIHEGGFRLKRHPNGRIEVHRPDGTLLPETPWGHTADESPAATYIHAPPDATRPVVGTSSGPPVRPPTRFTRLAERTTAQDREDDWHAYQIDLGFAELRARAEAEGLVPTVVPARSADQAPR